MPRPRPPPRRASFANGQNFRKVGLHQCPSERKGEGVPVRIMRVLSLVPSQPQTAAKLRGFSPIASGFTAETDWLLEEGGFEPSVPLYVSSVHSGACDATHAAIVKTGTPDSARGLAMGALCRRR